MKKNIRVLAIYGTLAVVSVFANFIELRAQTPAASPAPTQCTPENKLAWYAEFRKIFLTDQTKAYDLAQMYLACPAEAGEESIRKYLKDTFVAVIDKARRTPKVTELVYDKKDYAKAFELGKQVLTDEPDNVKVMMDLAYAGYLAHSNKVETFNQDSLVYAKKAIQLIQSGTVPDTWAPYAGKDETLSYLNNTIGVLTVGANPSEALASLLKAAQFEGKLKKQPITYGIIADAYQLGPYSKLSADYKLRFEGKDETAESKLALENINQVIDRMIDAYARAVALSGNEAAYQNKKTAWMEALTTWYKYRHSNSDAGLTELIAGVMTKPLPPEPTPLTTLPATPTTSTTPAAGNSTTAGSNGATGTTQPPATNKATATTTTVAPTTNKKTTASETASTKPAAKPKARNNHRPN
ncbi:MAG TPA: hypothetical protein VGO68_19700 [Pyrinomonadaceae bacterium]|jgi:hypothetical protein|nr:hypothetical protein [Pyrinomonadaceae bacterium]